MARVTEHLAGLRLLAAHFHRPLPAGFLVVISLFLASVPAFAADWTGDIDNDWNNPGNWSTGEVPDEDTDVTIKGSDAPIISGSVVIGSLDLKNNAVLTIDGLSAGLTVGGNLEIKNGAALAFNGDSLGLTVNGDFEIKNNADLSFNNSSAAFTVHGNTAAKNNAVINLSAGLVNLNQDVEFKNNVHFNAGSGGVHIGGNLEQMNNAAFNGGSADIHISGDVEYKNNAAFNAGSSTVIFDGDSDQTIEGDFVFNNVVFETDGDLTFDGEVTVTGDATLEGDTTLDAPELTVEGTFDVEGEYEFPGDITINSGSKLLLSQSDRINDSSDLTLAGGVFETGNYNETLGTLTLTGDSTIDFTAGGSSAIHFDDSSGESWSGTLTIVHWNENDELKFGSDSDGLTTDQVNSIVFSDPYGDGFDYTAKIGANGVVAPDAVIGIVPEPGTCFFLFLLGGTLAAHERKRLKGIWRRLWSSGRDPPHA